MQNKTEKFKKPIKSQAIYEQRQKEFVDTNLSAELKLISALDFFSLNAFSLLIKAKMYAFNHRIAFISSKMLLLSAAKDNLSVAKLLHISNKTRHKLEKFILKDASKNNKFVQLCNESNKRYLYRFDAWKVLFRKIRIFLAYLQPFSLIRKNQPALPTFSSACLLLFENASKNAKMRFYTPLVSTNILLITLLEEGQLTPGTFLELAFSNELKWLMFRYMLLKRIYEQEMRVRTQIQNKHFYYAYLLAALISESKCNLSFKNEKSQKMVLMLRAALIKQALQTSVLKAIINLIAQRSNKRLYIVRPIAYSFLNIKNQQKRTK